MAEQRQLSTAGQLKTTDFKLIQGKFEALTDSVTFQREVAFAVGLVRNSRKLQECDARSTFEAVYQCATTGFSLNPTEQLAYLIPYHKKVTLRPSFRGLIKVMVGCGAVSKVEAHVVRAGDDFSYSLGLNPDLTHKPGSSNTTAEITHTYAIAWLPNGQTQFVVLAEADIATIKDCAVGDGIWNKWPAEMRKKAAVRRLDKMVPKVAPTNAYHEAMRLDNEAFDMPATISQLGFIESLLDLPANNVCPAERIAMRQELESGNLAISRATAIIERLKQDEPMRYADDIRAAEQEQIKAAVAKDDYHDKWEEAGAAQEPMPNTAEAEDAQVID